MSTSIFVEVEQLGMKFYRRMFLQLYLDLAEYILYSPVPLPWGNVGD